MGFAHAYARVTLEAHRTTYLGTKCKGADPSLYRLREILILSPGCPACCWRDEIQGRAKPRISTKVLKKIVLNCGKKYSFEIHVQLKYRKSKAALWKLGLGKARKRCVLETSHPAE